MEPYGPKLHLNRCGQFRHRGPAGDRDQGPPPGRRAVRAGDPDWRAGPLRPPGPARPWTAADSLLPRAQVEGGQQGQGAVADVFVLGPVRACPRAAGASSAAPGAMPLSPWCPCSGVLRPRKWVWLPADADSA